MVNRTVFCFVRAFFEAFYTSFLFAMMMMMTMMTTMEITLSLTMKTKIQMPKIGSYLDDYIVGICNMGLVCWNFVI